MDNNNIFRPAKLDEFVGNEQIKKNLSIYLFSVKKRKNVLDHILIYGPPGVGKTSLANVISNELNAKLITIAAPVIKTTVDLINLVATINKGDILFIDEFHRLNKEVEEVLYSVLEDFKICINFRSEETNKVIELNIPKFTLIGATTLLGKISNPLRDRFPILFKLDPYTEEEIYKILSNNVSKLNLKFENEGLKEIARRSRNIPRIANNYLRRFIDYSLFYSNRIVDKNFAFEVFNNLGIDELGLSKDDYSIIKILYEDFYNEPVSLESIAIKMNESVFNIIEVNEPYLVILSLVERTKRGRKLTEKGVDFYKKHIMNKA